MKDKALELILSMVDEDIENTPMGMNNAQIAQWGGTLTGNAGRVLHAIYTRYFDALVDSRKISKANARNYMEQLMADTVIMAQIPTWAADRRNTGETPLTPRMIKVMSTISSVFYSIRANGADGSTFTCNDNDVMNIMRTVDKKAVENLGEGFEVLYVEAWKYYDEYFSDPKNIEIRPVEKLLLAMAGAVLEKDEDEMHEVFFDLIAKHKGDKFRALFEIKEMITDADNTTDLADMKDRKRNAVNDIMQQISNMKS